MVQIPFLMRAFSPGGGDGVAYAAGLAAAAADGQGGRETAGAAVNVRWVLRRTVGRAVTKIPVPGSDRPARLIGKLHGQRRLAGTGIGRKIGGYHRRRGGAKRLGQIQSSAG